MTGALAPFSYQVIYKRLVSYSTIEAFDQYKTRVKLLVLVKGTSLIWQRMEHSNYMNKIGPLS